MWELDIDMATPSATGCDFEAGCRRKEARYGRIRSRHFGGGSGGGGKSTTEAKSEYPEEFKPLAKSSVSQIQALQAALPLSSFAGALPRQVAGLSPFTVAGMELVPLLTRTTEPERQLGGLSNVWQDLTNRSMGLMSPPSNMALGSDYLLSLVGARPTPQYAQNMVWSGAAPQAFNVQNMTSPVPWPSPQSTDASAFGPGAPTTIPSPLAQAPIANVPPLLPTFVPPVQAAPAAPAVSAAPQISPAQIQILRDMELSRGATPTEAELLAHGYDVNKLYPGQAPAFASWIPQLPGTPWYTQPEGAP